MENIKSNNRLLVIPLLEVKFRITTPEEFGHGYFIWKKKFSIREDLRILEDDNNRLMLSESQIGILEESEYWIVARYLSNKLDINRKDENVRNIAKLLLVLFRIVKISRLFEYAQLTYSEGDEERFILNLTHAKGEVFVAEDEVRSEYVYTKEDIEKTKKIFNNFYTYLVDGNVKEGKIQSSLLFFKIASESYVITVRLVNMSIALESIFSTSRHELKYRISQRVAFFLGINPSKRTEVYNNMKTIYNLRSEIVHGAVVKKKNMQKIMEYLPLLEEYLRLSLIKILENSHLINTFGDNTKIDKHFDRVILE